MHTTFLRPGWRRQEVGGGAIEQHGAALRFVLRGASALRYSDAQIDDYQVGAQQPLLQRPPLRLSVRARFSHVAGALRGTAGFGFWNYPLAFSTRRLPRLPQALWFFYASPPADMRLDRHLPGWGWKAAAVDALRPSALALLPFAPAAALLMRSPMLYRRIWPTLQLCCGVREAVLPVALTESHTYTLDWGRRYARFSVDGVVVLDQVPAPPGPLCCVVWIDNQYLIVTPQGRLGWGLLGQDSAQWLELEKLEIRG